MADKPDDNSRNITHATGRARLARWCVNLALLALVTGATLAAGEWIVRRYEVALFGSIEAETDRADEALVPLGGVADERVQAFSWQADRDGPLHIKSDNPELVYELRPEARVSEYLSTNAFGFRDHEFTREKPADVFRIALVGDSVSFGWWEELDRIFPKVLERLLNESAPAGRRFEVLNLAVGGYNSEQEAAMAETEALSFSPDLILVQYCVNDGIMDYDAGLWRHFTATRSKLWDLTRHTWMRLREKLAREDLVRRSYRRLARIPVERGVPVRVVMFPDKSGFLDEGVVRFTQELGLPVLNLTAALRDMGFDDLFYDAVHVNTLGHRIAAEELYAWLCGEAAPVPCNEATQTHWREARAAFRRGLDALAQGSDQSAFQEYQAAAALLSEYRYFGAQALTAVADRARSAEDFVRAEALARLGVGLDDGFWPAYLLLGRLYDARNDSAQALWAYERYVEHRIVDPGFESFYLEARAVRFRIAQLKEAVGDLDGAIAAYLRTKEVDPGNGAVNGALVNVMRQRAGQLEAAGDLGKALELWKGIQEHSAPEEVPAALSEQARILVLLGNRGAARELLFNGIAQVEARKNPVVYIRLDELLRSDNAPEERLAEWRGITEAQKEAPFAHYFLASALLETGRTADALAEYREAARLYPDSGMAHTGLGDALVASGNLPEAAGEFCTALELSPANAYARDRLASVLGNASIPPDLVERAKRLLAAPPSGAAAQ